MDLLKSGFYQSLYSKQFLKYCLKTFQLIVIPVTAFLVVLGIIIFVSGVGEEEIGELSPVFFEGYPQNSQNDRWCSTTWIIHHENSIDSYLIEEKIRQKISEFGDTYDIAERRVTIKPIDEKSSRISVQGVWNETFENKEPHLTSFMNTLGFSSVEESVVICA